VAGVPIVSQGTADKFGAKRRKSHERICTRMFSRMCTVSERAAPVNCPADDHHQSERPELV
jgi:hypothetical protein